MEFHSLSRRELQTLCKKNKIPANITNVAMADALKALKTVEGLEEFLLASQSESAQSTIEPMDGLEMTSPYVPPSGVRSTRRRQAADKEPVTVKSMSRSRQATQKKSVKNAPEPQDSAIEVPALLKEDLMKECVENEKKDVLMTPAPAGATGRRRRVKENTMVERVYSTRRSVRLAEKNSEIGEKKLPTAIGFSNMDMNVKEDIGDSEEISGVTGVDASTNSLEYPEEYEVEVVSAREQGLPTGEEIKLGAYSEEEKNSHYEADATEKMGIPSEEEKNSHTEVHVPEQKMVSCDVAHEELTEQGDQNSEEKNSCSEIDVPEQNIVSGDAADEEVTEQDVQNSPRVSASVNLNHGVEGSGVGEKGKRGLPFDAVDDPEQKMKAGPEKDAGIQFDTEAEWEEKTNLNNEAGTGSNTEVEMDDAKNDMVHEDTSGEPNLNDDAAMESNTESKESDKSDGPSSENEVSPLHLNDEATTRSEPNLNDDAATESDTDSERSDEMDVPSSENEVAPTTGIDTQSEQDKEGAKTEYLSGGAFMALNMNYEVLQCNGPKEDCAIIIETGIENMVGLNKGSEGFPDDSEVGKFSCNTETKEEMHEDRTVAPEDAPHLDEAVERLTELELQEATKEISAGTGDEDFIDPLEEVKKEEPVDIGTYGNEESAKPEADLVPQNEEQAEDEAAATKVIAKDDEPQSPQIPIAQHVAMPKETLNSMSKASIFTDNKENIGSGCKLEVKKQKAKTATEKENLHEKSIRKLTKMLKEKLELNSKDANHGNKGVSRTALQVLPEGEESHN